LWVSPKFSRRILTFLAKTQATKFDERKGSAPGKILHQRFESELARTDPGIVLESYASLDATPLFVLLAARYLLATADTEFLSEIRPAIVNALLWMERGGDSNGDG